ncbi:50S ribosomal protein L11 methyltransferase [Eudoraea chungangensis]|uniref:50S ribosomal protein L11 methyltransferase n=1 Tax=Eudoraea chungangensis TaxID=1481905 RepID=UPI0023ECBFF2|nr:50S ribosomal protein L11 methyltransferase [Eudoraea chungangensis]
MDKTYVEYVFKTRPLQPASDILLAELADLGFESFIETKEGLKAYVLKDFDDIQKVNSLAIFQQKEYEVSFTTSDILQQNWNADWENSFNPIHIGDLCTVRAPFHEIPSTKYDLVITPKMSFGTGHHETTYMMLSFLLDAELREKSVLDMGCGTGVLGILAEKKGARTIEAIDIDSWSYQNTLENIKENKCTRIQVKEGDVSLLKKHFDVIVANINRNILLEDIRIYAGHLKPEGTLFLSGFYLKDLNQITDECEKYGLNFQQNLEKNNWVAAKYVF